MVRQTDRQTDTQTHRLTDRQTDRQTDRHAHTKLLKWQTDTKNDKTNMTTVWNNTLQSTIHTHNKHSSLD